MFSFTKNIIICQKKEWGDSFKKLSINLQSKIHQTKKEYLKYHH